LSSAGSCCGGRARSCWLTFAGILLAILPSAGGVLGGLMTVLGATFGALRYVVLIAFRPVSRARGRIRNGYGSWDRLIV
jgi:hypothetical protein